jgi:hypothetical protein
MHKPMLDYPGPRLTRPQMRIFLQYGWGEVGTNVFRSWEGFNERFFEDKLRPAPIVLIATSPYGHWVGCTHGISRQRRVAFVSLTAPYNEKLASDRGVLLHEMVHAWLFQRGENPAHEAAPWCREITRLSALLGRPEIKAAPEKVKRVNGAVKRVAPDGSIDRMAAARWPHSAGIELGSLLRTAVDNGPPQKRAPSRGRSAGPAVV